MIFSYELLFRHSTRHRARIFPDRHRRKLEENWRKTLSSRHVCEWKTTSVIWERNTEKHSRDRLQSLSVYIAADSCLHWPNKAINGIFNYFWHNFEGLRRFPVCFRSKSLGNKEHWFRNFMNEKLQFIEKTSQQAKTKFGLKHWESFGSLLMRKVKEHVSRKIYLKNTKGRVKKMP